MLRRLLLVAAMVLTVGSTLMPEMASAQPESPATSCLWVGTINGRNDCYGYFTGAYYPFDNSWDNVISSGMEVTTASLAASEADFLAQMSAALNGASLHDNVGAAFLINVMIGMDGPNFNCPGTSANTCRNNGISWARTHWAQWAKVVHYYNSKGMVDWNYPYVTPCPYYENSAYSATIADVTYHSKTDCGRILPAIHFYDPTPGSGTDMMIERICANMLGNANKLNVPSYVLEPDVIPGNGMAWGDTVQPYDGTPATDYYLTATAHNIGQLPQYDSDAFQLQVDNISPGYAVRQLDSPTSPDTYDTGPTGYATSCSIPGANCWYWTYGNGLQWNRTSRQINAIHFRVAAATPEGTQLCFAAWINDSNFGDLPASVGPAGHCFVVHHPRFVSVQGHNSDIHAGTGICGGPVTSGAIQGNPSALGANGTYGDYVVSASALAGINGISSNATTTSPTSDVLKLGNAGGYAQACRPDLVKAAQTYVAAGTGYITRGNGYTLTAGDQAAAAGAGGVIFVNGNATIPAGTVMTQKVTLYATGTVTIAGNVAATGGNSRANLPSLGIIAIGGVTILPTATAVDAYIFTNGDINTCNGLAASCNNTLTVRGFLMANSLTLRRLGPLGSINAQIGENVSLSPQIYLNPPKLFDASVDDILLEGQGEKRPLF
jgi:hypothetical protein